MGLAASQGRFLVLTSRKTDLEYQGQQINQERLVLSNTSSTLFNQYLSISVPVPPDSSSYPNQEAYEAAFTQYQTDLANYNKKLIRYKRRN